MGKVCLVEDYYIKITLTIIFLIITIFYQANLVTSSINYCPNDDTFINNSTVLNISKSCFVPDKGNDGVLIIKSSDIVLDCRGAVLKGNFTEYPDVYKFGILNDGHENVTVKNCVIKNYGDGILFLDADNNRIVNNTLINNSNGVVFDNCTHNELSNNSFYSNNKGIVLLPFSMENTVIKNNIYSSIGAGIEVEGSYENTISNNFIGPTNDSMRRGIWLRAESHKNQIFNNTFSGNTTIVQGEYRKKSYSISFSTVKPSPQTVDIIQNGNIKFKKVFTPVDVIYLPEGNYTLIFNSENYKQIEKEIELDSNIKISTNIKTGEIDFSRENKTGTKVDSQRSQTFIYTSLSILFSLLVLFLIYRRLKDENFSV